MKRTLNGKELVGTVRYLGSDAKKYRSQITLDGFTVSVADYSHYSLSKRSTYDRAYRATKSIFDNYRG